MALPALAQPVQGPAPANPVAATPEAAGVPIPVPSGPTLTKADVDSWLDGFMPYALARGAVAGAVVVVVKDGAVLTQRGFGYSDVEKRTPVDPETTLFRPGSVSKLFTWTAVMQLVQEGKLDLDADVNTYLDFKIPARDGKPVTLRNILTHTAGFEEQIRGLISVGKPAPLGDLLKRWVPNRIFAPGTTPAYSNYATALAGYIVERASGMSFDDYIDQRIFAPLGMNHSSFRQPLPQRLQPLMSKGYATASGEPKPYEVIGLAPAGSLAASGADMAKFMIAHLSNGGPLLSPETAKLMHTTTLTILPPLNRMALGFYEQQINGQTAIGHGGDSQWFHSNLMLFPQENVGIYISMNSAGKEGVTSPIRSHLFEGFADRYFPLERTITAGVDAKTAAEHAKMLAGTYISSRRAESSFMKALDLAGGMKIALDAKGNLVLPFKNTGGEDSKWVETAPFVWEEVGGHGRLAAKLKDGKVDWVSIDAISAIMMLQRPVWYASPAWLSPGVIAGLVILGLTALSWPVGAVVRRRYGARLALVGKDLKVFRLVRGFAAAVTLVLIGWATTIITMMGDFSLLGGAMDWAVYLLQIVGTVAFIGMVAVAAWNLVLVWTGARGWFSKLWSVLILLAAIVILWAAFAFHLISFGVQF
ncbi:serine hydrolase domain-containing protein [Sphingosinicella soli]|uniref:CubicO group peptidase (Beta-lactamase class C family) n=1 Tax=Sphingosinicella soli TaxID=333708 RepID=A0A7W7F7U1_9SPHN|nr:serine hydrolase domain-containing protein [Sphingosinicella soli]MBB4630953.1 CubicO group peptidase (beta-lactamase class C family) [Sphingosinicella soli]